MPGIAPSKPARVQNKRTCLPALLLLAGMSLHAEVRVLSNFTLIDGTGRAPVAGSAMIVDNGRIQWVGPAAQLKAPAGAETVDLKGKFVMPGIINLHGHVGNVVNLKQDGKFFTRENIEKNLKTYAEYGVTTVVSMGTDQDLMFKIRDEQRAGRPTYARVYSAGQGFIAKNAYGGLPGVTRELEAVADVAPAVKEQAGKKVDLIKIWFDDHLGSKAKMPLDMAKAIITNSHEQKLPALAHIFYLEDAKHLANFGVDAFGHSVRDKPVDQAFIDLMKSKGIWLAAATLTREASVFAYAKAPRFLDDPFFSRSVSKEEIATLKSPEYQKTIASDPFYSRYPEFLETAKRNLKKLVDAGVKVGFGTDTGPPGRFPGFFEHWEMELMADAGLTPNQIISAATKNSAEFLKAKDIGTLETGKWADVIVLNRNPLQDIKNTRAIHSVYIAGNKVPCSCE